MAEFVWVIAGTIFMFVLPVNLAHFGPGVFVMDLAVAAFVIWFCISPHYKKKVLNSRSESRGIDELLASFRARERAEEDEALVQRKLSAQEWLLAAEHYHPGQARRMAPSQYALKLWMETNKNASYVGPPRVYEDREAIRAKLEEERKARERRAVETDKPDPRATAEKAWLENRRIPERQQYGVSPQGAELLTAQWLLYLGQNEVRVTPYTSDGGVDVYTSTHAVQVKNYSQKPVGVSEVRNLLGAAVSESRRPLLFTATSLTRDAQMFCEMNSISVVRFDAEFATLEAITFSAEKLLAKGKYRE